MLYDVFILNFLQELRKLKLICHDMELNTQDLEKLVENYEANQETHNTERWLRRLNLY